MDYKNKYTTFSILQFSVSDIPCSNLADFNNIKVDELVIGCLDKDGQPRTLKVTDFIPNQEVS